MRTANRIRMTLDLAPVIAISPDGTRYEPVRVQTGEVFPPLPGVTGALLVTDRDRTILAHVKITGQVQMGRRRGVVECADGRWLIENPCGTCGSRGRRLRAAWEFGDTHPRSVGT